MRELVRWFWLALAAGVVACTPSDPPAQAPDAKIEIVHEPGHGWLARYSSSGPIDGLRFRSRGGWFREQEWSVRTPGYAYGRSAGTQALDVQAGLAPVMEVEVSLNPAPSVAEDAWPAVVPFTDGGIALYTGFVDADDAAGLRRWSISGRGEYAYFGPGEVVVDTGVGFIFDPALPEWMRATAMRWAPGFIDHYGVRTGHPAPDGVLVLVTYAEGGSLELSGAATPGTLLLTVRGEGWHQDDPWLVYRFTRFIAHETAHLWNAGLVSFAPGTPRWLYEGLAEAFAARAMLELGLLGREQRVDELRALELRCREGTGRPDYDCGNMLLDALEPHLFTIWGAVMDRASANDGRYDVATLCEELSENDVPFTPCRGGTGAHRAGERGY